MTEQDKKALVHLLTDAFAAFSFEARTYEHLGGDALTQQIQESQKKAQEAERLQRLLIQEGWL